MFVRWVNEFFHRKTFFWRENHIVCNGRVDVKQFVNSVTIRLVVCSNCFLTRGKKACYRCSLPGTTTNFFCTLCPPKKNSFSSQIRCSVSGSSSFQPLRFFNFFLFDIISTATIFWTYSKFLIRKGWHISSLLLQIPCRTCQSVFVAAVWVPYAHPARRRLENWYGVCRHGNRLFRTSDVRRFDSYSRGNPR